ncbi:hypothetical protein [Komagataeibacter diospyri]|uniref:Uncharacterized protein n=1 Tax=Komagataeibacter diospyri TaxID=1932662 RepID=A0A4P5P558_9PROT|nr:hypothetical protein [Komagataeibacter diospyri]GCE83889.1 hypothetical protein MSKU9_2030 [Komagataeibacter diospyri]GCE90795.1 hypothetical protein MSKU15_2396 [Komagataeibacter diospyri]
MQCIPAVRRYGAHGLIWTAHFAMAVVLASVSAHAAGREDQASACKNDVFRLCFLDIPNEKLMTECLESKLSQLSPKCRAMFEDDEAQDAEHKQEDAAVAREVAPTH